jgi:hypothetical protein
MLLHYFGNHPICVITSYGLGEIIGNRLAMGLDIAYIPQMANKSLATADFMAEWTETLHPPPRSPKSTRESISMDLQPQRDQRRRCIDLP